eukprot:12695942-Ditylum_brightwellii.AAC.1
MPMPSAVATCVPDSAQALMFRPDSSVMSAKVSTRRCKLTAFSLSSVHVDGLKRSKTSMRTESKTRCAAGCQEPGTMIDALQHFRKVLMLLSQLART